MALSPDELQLVIRIYLFVGLTLGALIFMKMTGRLSPWLARSSLAAFIITALGWEVWFTYGLVAGDTVNARRSDALNAAIPQDLNWALNSLADVGMCLIGLLLVRRVYGPANAAFRTWKWGAFGILFAWFMVQNLYVELVIYARQLTSGTMSWAPMAPNGPWFNPVLFEVGGHPATLQGQIPWVIMTPLFYWAVIRLYNRDQRQNP